MPTKSVFFLETAQPRPGIVRRHGAVRILADDDIALLGAQHVHGLGAVEAGAHRLRARSQIAFQTAAAVIGRHVDFVTELAGEGHAEQPRRHAA